MPATMAVGVASPREQGQAITSTETIFSNAFENPAPGTDSQYAKVISDSTRTTGTKTAATLSTVRWMAALLP